MKLYFYNIRTQSGWEHVYHHHVCDADAMTDARAEMEKRNGIMVAVYRHEDEDTCGIKHFVVSYDLP